MANYFVVNSKFTPYSYEELIKPMVDYGKAYKEQEEKAEALNAQLASTSELFKNDAGYQDLTASLNSVVSQLSTSGLNANTRKELSNLKSHYAAYDTAASSYKDMIAKREAIKAKDNSAIFVKDDYTASDFIGGKQADNTYISGDDVAADALSQTKAYVASSFDPSAENAEKVLGNYYYQLQTSGSLSKSAIDDLQQHPELYKIYNDIYDRYSKGLGEKGQDELRKNIYKGMYTAVAAPKYEYKDAHYDPYSEYKKNIYELQQTELRQKIGLEPFFTNEAGDKYYWRNQSVVKVSKSGDVSMVKTLSSQEPKPLSPNKRKLTDKLLELETNSYTSLRLKGGDFTPHTITAESDTTGQRALPYFPEKFNPTEDAEERKMSSKKAETIKGMLETINKDYNLSGDKKLVYDPENPEYSDIIVKEKKNRGLTSNRYTIEIKDESFKRITGMTKEEARQLTSNDEEGEDALVLPEDTPAFAPTDSVRTSATFTW